MHLDGFASALLPRATPTLKRPGRKGKERSAVATASRRLIPSFGHPRLIFINLHPPRHSQSTRDALSLLALVGAASQGMGIDGIRVILSGRSASDSIKRPSPPSAWSDRPDPLLYSVATHPVPDSTVPSPFPPFPVIDLNLVFRFIFPFQHAKWSGIPICPFSLRLAVS